MKQIFTNNANWGRFIFIAVFILLCWVYDLDKTLSGRPQSIHIWRQTNSLSIALNYYNQENPLMEPEIQNQFCDDGMSGKTAGEFPIIYYGVAKLWKIFGVHEWIFRLVQLLILFFGLFALFELSNYFLKNQFWSGFVSLLLFTSPMLVFYGINFLPDGPSLALMFIGWYFVLQFQLLRKTYWLWIAAFFFTFALVLKITSAISLIAFLGWLVFESVFRTKEERIFNFRLQQLWPFVTIVTLSMVWYLYANHYNKLHQGEFSYLGIWPIWRMTSQQFSEIKDAVDKIFFKEYMNPYLQYLTIFLWIILVARFRKNTMFQNWLLILLPLGALSVLLLWFQVLNAHDYYLVTLLFMFAFTWFMVFFRIKDYRWMKHPLMYILLLTVFSYNVFTCEKQLSNRYRGWMNDLFVNHLEAVGELEPILKQLHIGKSDHVISIPDPSVAASLYFMNRQGYTDFGSDFNQEEQFRKRIEQGAKYLVVNDTTILDRPVVKAFAQYLMGQYRNVKIYDLRPFAERSATK